MLVFTHVFNPELGPDWQHAAGWEAYLDRLEAHLHGGFLSEEDAHAGIDERLAATASASRRPRAGPSAPRPRPCATSNSGSG